MPLMLKEYVTRLDPDQQKAVLADPAPLLVMAGAGSGKTALLTSRVAHMIDTGVASPEKILVSAFTRVAANEMQERVQSLTDCSNLVVGTFHSIMFKFLNDYRAASGRKPYGVCKEGPKKIFFQGILDKPSKNYPQGLNLEADLGNVMAIIGRWKNSCIVADGPEVRQTADEAPRNTDEYAAAKAYPLYEEWLASQNLIDFDDMLLKTWVLLTVDPNALSEARARWDAFFVDECQPSGTMVLTPNGEVPIETLSAGDKVIAYDQRNQRVGKRGNVVNGITGKPYRGKLVVVEAGGKRTRYTPNHHCIALMGPALAGKHLVYLMRRGQSYRVGISTAKHGARRATAGPVGRMREERADAVWILGAYDSKTEALMEEAYASASFGLPQQRFVAGGSGIATQDSLDAFWRRMGNLQLQAECCLEAYGRDIRYPISEWVDGEKKHLLQSRTSVIRACNLMDGMVVIDGSEVVGRKVGQYVRDPAVVGACDAAWKSIKVSYEHYDGLVWSMDVDVRHTYIGDGIVTHNCQDTNVVQFKLLELIAPPTSQPNITLVGDLRQCQPAGTNVTVIDRPGRAGLSATFKEVPIEDVAVGDRVVSYDISNTYFHKGIGREVTGVAQRSYEGPLVTVEVAGRRSRYTPDHRVVARMGDSLKGKWVVYLMRRGSSYRVGQARGMYESQGGQLGFVQRINHEDADAGWILSVHDSASEASLHEALTSWTWQIPSLRFKRGSGERMTQAETDLFWEKMGDLTVRAEACLAAHGRLIGHPLFDRGSNRDGWAGNGGRKMLLRRRATVIAAANLLDGMEMLPFVDTKGKSAHRKFWAPAKVSTEWYSGTVHSLEVEEFETYVADGITTHNCLYSFRGAAPELVTWFEERWKAQRIDLINNYRSVHEIVSAANQLAGNMGMKDQKSTRGTGNSPVVQEFNDVYDQALGIVEDVADLREQGMKGGDIAILTRTNAQSAPIESAFVKAGLPYWSSGGGFFDLMEVGDLIAYLRLANERTNVDLLERIINRPTRYLGKAFAHAVAEKAAAQFDGDLVKALRFTDSYPGKKLWKKQREAAIALADLLEGMSEKDDEEPIRPTGALYRVLNSTSYMEWLKKTTGLGEDADSSRQENVDALLVAAGEHYSIRDFLKFVDESKRLQMESDDATQILTTHRSKGGQWDVVWVSNMHDDSFPHKAAKLEGNLLPERRVAYVAFTRAKNQLKIAVPATDDKGNSVAPSRYISDAGLEITESVDSPLVLQSP